PKLETYRYAMPGEANVTQYEIATIDIASKTLTKVKADKFKDQTLQIATAPVSPRFAGGGRGGQNPDAPPPIWLSDSSDQQYVTTNIEAVDDKARVAYVSAVGREAGEDPYFPHLYRVSYDGATTRLLNPGDAAHASILSESARYFVDNASRIDGAPSAVLYDT